MNTTFTTTIPIMVEGVNIIRNCGLYQVVGKLKVFLCAELKNLNKRDRDHRGKRQALAISEFRSLLCKMLSYTR